MRDRIKSFTHTDLPLPVAHATNKCGIDSSVLITVDQSTALPNDRLVKLFFICVAKSADPNTSPSLTMLGLGFGICIHTVSVPGIGAIILSDLVLSDEDISSLSDSIEESLIPASGLILNCTIDGQISNPSICIATPNSISLLCNALAFSIKNVSSIVAVCQILVCISDISNVGLSLENDTTGLIFSSFSAIFSCTFCLSIVLITLAEIGTPIA